MTLLEVQSIDVHYGAIQALHQVSFRVDEGQIVTLIGANGAGKSTTLRAISGIQRISNGRIQFCGTDIHHLDAHKIVRIGISHCPEGRGIFSNLSVHENLEIGSYIRKDRKGIREDRDRIFSLFPRLLERLHQNAGTLSGGEQQMLAIGRALLAKPRLLLLDEPSLGLAPQIVQTIFQIIREINYRGTTVLLVEQNANQALQCAQEAHVLEVGQIVLSGDSKTLLSDSRVKNAYLGIHEAGDHEH